MSTNIFYGGVRCHVYVPKYGARDDDSLLNQCAICGLRAKDKVHLDKASAQLEADTNSSVPGPSPKEMTLPECVHAALELAWQIEKLPASEQQTKCSLAASQLFVALGILSRKFYG